MFSLFAVKPVLFFELLIRVKPRFAFKLEGAW
jgi:hypothetical protein